MLYIDALMYSNSQKSANMYTANENVRARTLDH